MQHFSYASGADIFSKAFLFKLPAAAMAKGRPVFLDFSPTLSANKIVNRKLMDLAFTAQTPFWIECIYQPIKKAHKHRYIITMKLKFVKINFPF